MPLTPAEPLPLRERTRRQVSRDLAAVALELFDQQGFDATTVDDIAGRAGISQRTFFRYFPTKEDVVLDADVTLGRELVDALGARPVEEPPWAALGRALRVRTARWEEDRDRARLTLRLIDGSADLRARLLGRNLAWQDLLRDALVDRLTGAAHPRLRASALVASSFGCLDAAYRAWCEQDDADLDELFDVALSTLASLDPRASA